jgi:ribosome biogenesis GTPase / thiamine phosphate phosphatase
MFMFDGQLSLPSYCVKEKTGKKMKLEDLGFLKYTEKLKGNISLNDFVIGRVIAEHKERYLVRTDKGEFDSEITGNLRFSAKDREDFPAVGDWVALITYDSGTAIIHRILPRTSVIKRRAVGQSGDVQVIASNVDRAFLVQAADRDFNINRLERYLAICNSSGIEPIIVLTKTDLISDTHLDELLIRLRARIKDIPIIPISNQTMNGIKAIINFIERGKTCCMLGSSGVGKSSLLNNLVGKNIMKTDVISQSTNKGKHVTSHRELVVLENGGILIDNPGMREVGIADAADGLDAAFGLIYDLTKDCRFKDCTHTTEIGCRVIDAVEKGEIDRASYQNFLKMAREQAHFESSVAERRKKDQEFGKMFKNYKKNMKKRG